MAALARTEDGAARGECENSGRNPGMRPEPVWGSEFAMQMSL